MTSRRGSLQPAHAGYRYQDIATAYELVRALVERYERVVVDRKVVVDDRIDDLEIVTADGHRIRRQFKSSKDPQRRLTVKDFTDAGSTLRIDRLVLTHVRAGTAPADEYRLCATWQPPDQGDAIAALMEPLAASPTISGSVSQLYRIAGERLWPVGRELLWSSLLPSTCDPDFSRENVLAFCERFVIELVLPAASEELAVPGPLEQALIQELARRVGIGRYPNQGRTATDVAALAISLANLARTQEAALTPADVERALDIRTDFGRVAQAFPVDNALFHDRPAFRRIVGDGVREGRHQLVVAPPGAGKSWELTRLAEELSAEGAIVARHYCYLEPGDALVEQRVMTDVLFANLLAELTDAQPELRGAGKSRYAAGFSELEATLAKAVTLGRPVVLIIDGLDHIVRVRASAPSLSGDETDIVEQLATLDIPDGVAVIVGSQPGIHLDPLRSRWGASLVERAMPPWTVLDVKALARRYEVPKLLVAVGIVEGDTIDRVLTALAERADGNPLYARYLARGLIGGLQAGRIADPIDWIAAAPLIAGDVRTYYAYLYRETSAQAQAIADVLGGIDFAITEGELREMLRGPLAAWVPSALTHLAPVLTTATGQGGIRVFHESFRRFMAEELARQGRSTAEAIAPVIAWLEGRGFYSDAKSYRFLLPALRRAGRDTDILALVETTFVSESVAHGHPLSPIQRNLALAADVAACRLDWPALVRCVELHRAAYTCFDENQNTWDEYWATYCALFGPSALTERLLFDGRPTQTRDHGLLACSLADDAGGVAPWREYLELPDDSSADSSSVPDAEGTLTDREGVTLASVHGLLRLGEHWRVIRWVLRYLRDTGDEFRVLFVRQLAARLAQTTGPSLVEQLAARGNPTRRRGPRITRRAAATVRLGLADDYVRRGDTVAAVASATEALRAADTIELAAASLLRGAPSSATAVSIPEPSSIEIAVGPNEHSPQAHAVRAWVAAVRLCATDPQNGPATFDSERHRVAGVGWYRCWLRFVLRLSAAEASRPNDALPGDDADVVAALDELQRDVHPFRGTPRACDLWAIRHVLKETLVRGLSLLCTQTGWTLALEALVTTSHGTASRLDREDGGPLPTLTLLELLLPHVGDPVGGSLVRSVVEREVARRDNLGTYYSTHAEYAMRLARARLTDGNEAAARAAWAEAAVFLAAYGWHKDVTVYDLIQSAPALKSQNPMSALVALADIQPLTQAVIAHTDHRETRHAPNTWFSSLLTVDVAAGLSLLAATLSREHDAESWVLAEAIRDAARAATKSADPGLVDAVFGTILLEIEHDDEAGRRADERLGPIANLSAIDRPLAENALRQLAAAVTGDTRRHGKKAAMRVQQSADALGLSIPRLAFVAEAIPSDAPPSEVRWRTPLNEPRLPALRIPPFPPRPTVVDLLVGLRAAGRDAGITRGGWDDVVLALGYHLGQFVDADRGNDARRVLRFFARDTYIMPTGQPHPLGALAEALENGGYLGLAATAYALAYTATRGEMGYARLGDRTHSGLLARAFAFDPPEARRVLADEIAYALRDSWYSIGTSRHLIDRVADWGEPNVAMAAWREAAAVVTHRLPLVRTSGLFAPLRPNELPGWTVNQGLVALLLTRLSDPRLALKIAALAGVVRAIQRSPNTVVIPLRWWLTRDASVTSVLLLLDALLSAETKPYSITRGLEDVLAAYGRSTIWGAQQLSVLLLERAGLQIPTHLPVDIVSQLIDHPAMNARVLDEERLATLLDVDKGKRLSKLRDMWPELPGRVARRLDTLLRDEQLHQREVHRERIHDRFRLAYGRDGDCRPATPVLQWYTELFEVALHEQLLALSAQLWKAGRWAPGLERQLLLDIVPNTALHLGLAASRTVRPQWPAAEMLTDGLGPLPVLGDDDHEYTNWIRLGIVETHYVQSGRLYQPPTEQVTLYAGATALDLGDSIPPGTLPFSVGVARDWWDPKPSSLPILANLPVGPLVGLDLVTDWLGHALVLIPPTWLQSRMPLRVPVYGMPLVWCDTSGTPVVVLRTWRIRNDDALFAQPAEYEGTDLIVRPDVVDRLQTSYGVAIRELRIVRREPMRGAE
jgi:hypothetical protein